jgi:membrane-bound serine protease (ClpP class)
VSDVLYVVQIFNASYTALYHILDKIERNCIIKLMIFKILLTLLLPLIFCSNLLSESVYVIPVKGTIDLGLSAFIGRSIGEAKQANAVAIILDIDTYGGRLDATDQIASFISDAKPIPVLAFVRGQAWSAGALISLACRYIYMAEGSSIGSAQPRGIGVLGAQELDEKTISAVRAKFRSIAEENGHNPSLAEKMVDKDIGLKLVEYEGTIKILKEEELQAKIKQVGEEKIRTLPAPIGFEKGKLLNLSAQEAKTLKLASAIVNTIEDIAKEQGWERYEFVQKQMNWAEIMVRFFTDPTVSSILIMLGILGIIYELQMPGWGISGTLGIIFLAIFFWGHHLVGLADWIEIILVIAGLGLLAVEIFITPGFGIAGISGIILTLGGIFLAMVRHPFEAPAHEITQALYVITYALVGSILMLILTTKFVPKTHFWKRVALLTEERAEQGYTTQVERLKMYVDKQGVADSYLRPSGRIKIGDELIDAETQGEFIDKGEIVKVIRFEGSRVIVKKDSS